MSADSSLGQSRAHLPELDGIRTIAVVAVLLYHSFGSARSPILRMLFQHGWAGVDLFFVLSGFLITRILIHDKGNRGYFRNFYARRGLRIWPLYYAVVALMFIVVPRVGGPLSFDPATHPWWAYVLYLQNFVIGDFGPPPLNVTWSLAIEEHFYLVWPLLVYLVPRRALAPTLLAIATLSPVIRFVLPLLGATSHHVYVWTFCRLDALALGGLIAVWVLSPSFEPNRLRRVSTVGLLAIPTAALVLHLVFPHETPIYADIVPSADRALTAALIMSLVALGSAAIVGIGLTWRASPLGRVLRTKPMVWLGKVSYGLYIFHYAVFKIGQDWLIPEMNRLVGKPGGIATLLAIAIEYVVLLGIVATSWYLFESPLLRLKRRFEAKPSGGGDRTQASSR